MTPTKLFLVAATAMLVLSPGVSEAQDIRRYECGGTFVSNGFEVEARTIGKRSSQSGEVSNYISRASVVFESPQGSIRFNNGAAPSGDLPVAKLSYNLFTDDLDAETAKLASVTVQLSGFAYEPTKFLYSSFTGGRDLDSYVIIQFRKLDGTTFMEFPVSVMADKDEPEAEPDSGFFVAANIMNGFGAQASDVGDEAYARNSQNYLNSALEGIADANGAITIALNDYINGEGPSGDIVTFSLPPHDAKALIKNVQQRLRTDTVRLKQGNCDPQ